MQELSKHKFNVYPEDPEAIADIAADMRANGFDASQPVWLYQGAVIDGWQRYKASLLAGVGLETCTLDGDDMDAIAFMARTNKRRNLSSWQKAAVAAEAEELIAAIEAKAREAQGERTDLKPATLDKNLSEVVDEHANKTSHKVAAMFGTNRTYVNEARKLREEEPDAFERVKAGELSHAEHKAEVKRRERVEAIARRDAELAERPAKVQVILPSLVLADPPWRYDFAESDSRKIENQYPSATVEQIIAHAPETQPDCVLLLWATVAKLEEALEVMRGWGFTYKTQAVWDKEVMGMGYWFRGQHELLLVGTKGSVSPPEPADRVASVFRERRGKHSAKPECVYAWIERAFPLADKLEMYCRSPRAGWQVWGNQA